MNLRAEKERVKERDEHECRFCGIDSESHVDEYGRGLHAHHIVPQRADGSDRESNLITVCEDCHQLLENTQAEALSRIKQSYSPGVDNEEHREVVEQRNRLIERIHELERRNRDPDYYKQLLQNCRVESEVVSQHIGTRTTVTSDSERALEEYEEWGSSIQRTNVSVQDADVEEWAEKITDALNRIERFGYE